MPQIIWHFLKSLARWVRGRYRFAPEPVVEFRLMVCQGCEYRRRSRWRTFCHICGCTIGKRIWPFNKLALPHEECPLKKWMALNVPDQVQGQRSDEVRPTEKR